MAAEGTEGLAEGIARARQRAGYSIRELAGLAGIDRHAITDAEAGRRVPRPQTIRKLARALGVSVPELYGLPGPQDAPSVIWALSATDRQFERWVERADLDALLKVMPQLNRAPDGLGLERGTPERQSAYKRAQRVIREWTRRVGVLREVDPVLAPEWEHVREHIRARGGFEETA